MRLYVLVQLLLIYVVIGLGYVAGLQISCCIIAGPLVGTPVVYVMNICIYVAGLLQAGCFLPQCGV